jgi:hypothetical protein
LEAAIAALRSGDAEVPRPTPQPSGDSARATSPATDAILNRLRRLVEQAEADLRAGDWAGFGERWSSLRALLRSVPPQPQP